MTVISPYCKKHQDLAKFIIDCGKVSRVTVFVAKCEPLVEKADRYLE